MTNSQGFWSYVHDDDQAEGGRISRLAHDIVSQYEMMTGEKISLFLDTVALAWGDNWRDEIDSKLALIAFFIPVMSPRYFMSPECRRELSIFARQATDLGVKDLIMPLLYVDVPTIHEGKPDDELIALVKTFQWEDWRDLRFLDITSEGYRRGVYRLASRLVEANKHVEEKVIANVPQEANEAPDIGIDDSPGFIDRLADAEETLPRMQECLEAMTQEVILIGQIMAKATEDIHQGDSQGKGFAARLMVSRRVASQLSKPTEHIWLLSNEYASDLHTVDEGFRVIIERAPTEINGDPNSKTNFCVYFNAVRFLSTTVHEALEKTQLMIDSFEPLERISRDLRPVLRRLRQGLTIMVELRGVSDEWIHLIDSSGVVCEDTGAQVIQPT